MGLGRMGNLVSNAVEEMSGNKGIDKMRRDIAYPEIKDQHCPKELDAPSQQEAF